MIFLQPGFLLFALATILLAHALPRGIASAWLGVGLNLAFMWCFLGVTSTGIVLGFALLGYGALLLAPGRLPLLALSAALLAVFVVLKQYSFIPALLEMERLPVAVGLSYVLFRSLHLLIERAQNEMPLPTLAQNLQYTLSSHTLLSGPFQRYDEYRQTLENATRHEALPAFARIADGFIKVLVVAPLLQEAHQLVEPMMASGDRAALFGIAAALIWLVFMFFNFAGYMDIVIGWARLCRFDLPENFNRPLQASGFLDFWARWHMAMTGWFKSYVFNPLMLLLGRRLAVNRRAALLTSAIAFFFTFLLVGAWHGPTAPFLICGVLLGLGATCNQLFREWQHLRQKRRKAARLPQPPASWWMPPLQLLGAAFNFIYIAIAVSPFWLSATAYRSFLEGFVQSGNSLLVLLLSSAGLAAGLWVLRPLGRWLDTMQQRFAAGLASAPAIALRIVLLVMAVMIASISAPDFVYKGL